jgi:thioredoxin 1
MAEFKKLAADIDAIELSLLSPPDNKILPGLVSDCSTRIAKFIQRAREQDPEKKLYGEQMCAKIEQLNVRFEGLHEKFLTEYLPKLKNAEADAAAQRAEEERVALALAEEQKRHAAELKLKAQREEELKVAAEKEAAERMAAEIARAAEELRLEQILRKKEREEARLRKEEEERRFIKEKEEKAIREATEREEKERAERKRKAESLMATAKTSYGSGGDLGSVSMAGGGSGLTTPFRSGVVTEIIESSQFQLALLSARDSLVVVDWMAPWCGPCKMIAPHLESMAARLPHVVFLKVDGDKHPDLVSRNQIRAFPTFHFYFRNRLLMNFSGADKNRIEVAIEQHLSTIDDIITQEAVEASMKVDEPPPAPKTEGLTVPSSSSSSPSSSSSTAKFVVPSVDSSNEEALDAALAESALDYSTQDSKSAMLSASMALKVKESLDRLANGPPKLAMSELDAAASMIERLVENILKHPTDPTYRSVKKTNPTLVARLLRHGTLGETVLKSLGFQERVVDSTANFTYVPCGDGSTEAILSDSRLLSATKWLNAAKAAAAAATSTTTMHPSVNSSPRLKPQLAPAAPSMTDDDDPDLLAAIAASLQDK